MNNIIREFFTNATIIVAFITFSNHFFKEKGVSPSSPMRTKILSGITHGILGCVLMLYSIEVAPHILVDFRYIPIIIMALYASFPSAIITSLIIGIFRVAYFGFTQSSFIAFIIAIIIAIGCGFVGKSNIKRELKWVYSLIITFVVFGTALKILMPTSPLLNNILILYCISTSLVSIAIYYLVEYTEKTNEMYRQMKDETRKDFLTGLNNVRQFDALLNKELKNSQENRESLSLLFIDIDFFKKVNDDYGHFEGDNTLKEFGELLLKTCRNIDIVSRNGGEEFSVVLLDCGKLEAIKIAEHIRKAIEHHAFVLSTGKKIRITVSIGVFSFPDTIEEAEKLVEQADIALYKAKRAGRNRVEFA